MCVEKVRSEWRRSDLPTRTCPRAIVFSTIRRSQKRFFLVGLFGELPFSGTIGFLVSMRYTRCDAMRGM